MTQENPSFNLPEIPWLTEVKPEDLKQIGEFRGQGNSLAASVARTVLKEGTNLDLPQQYENVAHIIGVMYSQPPLDLLRSEEVIRTGKTAPNLSEKFEEAEKILGPLQQAVSHLREVFGQDDREEDRNLSEDAITMEAESLLYAEVLKRKGPLELIDFATNHLIEHTLPNYQGLPFAGISSEVLERVIRETLENSRQRFHQLYTAGQEAGLG